MDFARHQNLHTVIMLRDVIRKWWRCELGFADKDGEVLDWKTGDLVPPPNDFCRLALFTDEGLRRCAGSIRLLHDRFHASRTVRHALTQQCHQGFTVVGAPLYLHGEYEGFLFVEGFARRPLTVEESARAQAIIRELPGADLSVDLDRAATAVPVFGEADLEKLTDLLEFCVGEIASFEDALGRKDERIQTLASELAERYRFENLVGGSAAMRAVFDEVAQVSHSEAPVLIAGERGTGKALVARAIHYNGPRKDRPFVAQDASALDPPLLERALFGHVKGAFEGAVRDRKGLLELADGGTFFLEEVATLPAELQARLLRVVLEGTFVPVGGTRPRSVDLRIITSSRQDLAERVRHGHFSEELFQRLNTLEVTLPPLRERRDDIPVLVEHFLRKHHHAATHPPLMSAEALAVLTAHAWPGNVRELETEVERLLVLGGDLDVLPVELISPRIRDAVGMRGLSLSAITEATGNLNAAVEQLERHMIQRGLLRTGNNKSQLARELGISRSNLILKIARYGLEKAGTAEAPDSDNPEASKT